jgi:hypothetical protein
MEEIRAAILKGRGLAVGNMEFCELDALESFLQGRKFDAHTIQKMVHAGIAPSDTISCWVITLRDYVLPQLDIVISTSSLPAESDNYDAFCSSYSIRLGSCITIPPDILVQELVSEDTYCETWRDKIEEIVNGVTVSGQIVLVDCGALSLPIIVGLKNRGVVAIRKKCVITDKTQ